MKMLQQLLAESIKQAMDDARAKSAARLVETVANTKMIEYGLLDAFSGIHHTSDIHRLRGHSTHRRISASATLDDVIDNVRITFMRSNGMTTLGRLFGHELLGLILLLDNHTIELGDGSAEVDVTETTPKQDGQFLSVAHASDGTFRMAFNLTYIREQFGDGADDLLYDIGSKIHNRKAQGLINSTQDFVTIEELDEAGVKLAMMKMIRKLGAQDWDYGFLLVSGDPKEDSKVPTFQMDDEPADDLNDVPVDDVSVPAVAPMEMEDAPTIELFGIADGADKVSDMWPDVTYHGNNLFELIHDQNVDSKLDDALANIAGEIDGVQYKEFYIGYSPRKDTFCFAYTALGGFIVLFATITETLRTDVNYRKSKFVEGDVSALREYSKKVLSDIIDIHVE